MVPAAICQDYRGRVLATVSENRRGCNPLKGEALAAKRASSPAEELSLDIVIFEGDAQRLINQIIYEP